MINTMAYDDEERIRKARSKEGNDKRKKRNKDRLIREYKENLKKKKEMIMREDRISEGMK